MAENAALNSRQISRMHNKATSHGNSLSPSRESIYFTFPPRVSTEKNDRLASFFPFLYLSRIGNDLRRERKRIVPSLTGNTYVSLLLLLLLGSDFEFEPGDFIEKLSFSLSSFYLEEQRTGHR